jgi:predicted phosphodiesterase
MRLGVVSDIHWSTDPDARASWHGPFDFAGLAERVDRARAAFRRERVDAVVVSGDVANAGDVPSAKAALDRLAAGLGRPLLVVAGNHDCDERDDMLAGVTALLGVTEVDGALVTGVPIERGDDDHFRWTGKLAPGPAGVVVSHFPVLSREDRLASRGLKYAGDLTDRAQLQALVAGHEPVVVLSGHIHARETHAEGNLLQLSAGALIEAPHEIAVVDLAPGYARRRVSVLGPRVTPHDPVLATADETWTFAGGAWRPDP